MKASNFGLYPDWLSSNIMFHVAYNPIVKFIIQNFQWTCHMTYSPLPKIPKKSFLGWNFKRATYYCSKWSCDAGVILHAKMTAWQGAMSVTWCNTMHKLFSTTALRVYQYEYSNMNTAIMNYQKMWWYSLSISSSFSQSLSIFSQPCCHNLWSSACMLDL